MRRTNEKQGFTIVEMLTVMGIIAILIGLLIPALNQVKDYGRQIQQKAQFHSIEVALEMFKNDKNFEAYPDSSDNYDIYTGTGKSAVTCGGGTLPAITATNAYCGANKLAESLVGLDYLGVHPKTAFRADGLNCVVDKTNTQDVYTIYHLNTAYNPDWETVDENLNARVGPFIDLENANAFRMDEVYGTTMLSSSAFSNSIYTENSVEYYPLVLCDVFAKKRVDGVGNKKTGMPILYYRARNFTQQNYLYYQGVSAGLTDGLKDDIYYYPDNENLLEVGIPDDSTAVHPMYDDGVGVGSTGTTIVQSFESSILNKQVTTIKRPYRASSYILISAGKDGLYGTGDDITNFERGSDQ